MARPSDEVEYWRQMQEAMQWCVKNKKGARSAVNQCDDAGELMWPRIKKSTLHNCLKDSKYADGRVQRQLLEPSELEQICTRLAKDPDLIKDRQKIRLLIKETLTLRQSRGGVLSDHALKVLGSEGSLPSNWWFREKFFNSAAAIAAGIVEPVAESGAVDGKGSAAAPIQSTNAGLASKLRAFANSYEQYEDVIENLVRIEQPQARRASVNPFGLYSLPATIVL